ncbi:helix-turn-helix domain-containing protein [Actinomadura adrarensis]|uniref:Helix-turn-helix domain-containing protein n=1 Tax=Actinomadura adrarensis TaxID=1819600 RepID=A0ABW3CSP1_9ACTN
MELKAFGAEVRRLREEVGISRAELARRVVVTPSYISQVESGNTRCRKDFAARMDEALGTGTQLEDAWEDLLRSTTYPKYFKDYPVAEGTAAFLRAYEIMFVFGLFQTEAYLRALLQQEEDIEGRLRRQAVLKRPDPPMINVVLAENVLWTCVGDATVMHEQCEHLLAVSEWENVTLQVAPPAYYRGIRGAFNLATQPSGEELLYMMNARGGVTTDEKADILPLVTSFSAMQAHVLSADDSREFLRKAVLRWSS